MLVGTGISVQVVLPGVALGATASIGAISSSETKKKVARWVIPAGQHCSEFCTGKRTDFAVVVYGFFGL